METFIFTEIYQLDFYVENSIKTTLMPKKKCFRFFELNTFVQDFPFQLYKKYLKYLE